MGFSPKQSQALRRELLRRHVRSRMSNGRELSYIEGWHAIAEANRIFGFDGWDRETVDSRCAITRETRGTFLAVYTAKVRITVHAGGKIVVREGHGSGEGRGTSPGETHDIALKAAETDATKRALATFGKPFGLGLYLKEGQGGPVQWANQRSQLWWNFRHQLSPSRMSRERYLTGISGHRAGNDQ
jgi:DNA recombination protein Rad52